MTTQTGITPPARRFVLEFTKMSGAGNDFIVLDNRFYRFLGEELSSFAVRFCARRTGIGADGLLALNPATSNEAVYRMAYYNADGSLGTMCGNGARCLARFARQAGLTNEPLIFDSDAGIYSASVPGVEQSVRLFVPPPKGFRRDIKFSSAVPPGSTDAHYLWTGTEHAVVYVDDVENVNVVGFGSALRRDTLLGTNGANINFVQVIDDGVLRGRTFEKGVEAETLACGTGSIASSLVTALTREQSVNRYTVQMAGGTLYVGFEGSADQPESLYLEGPAEVVYRGSVEL